MGTQEDRLGEEHGVSSAVSRPPGQRTRIRVHLRDYWGEYTGDPEQGEKERKEPPRLQHLRLFHGLPGTNDLRKAPTRIRSEIELRPAYGLQSFLETLAGRGCVERASQPTDELIRTWPPNITADPSSLEYSKAGQRRLEAPA